MLRRISYWAGIAAIGTLVGFSIQFAKAWTEPASAPPAGNVAAPVNVSATAQVKAGALGVSGVFHGYSTGIFDGNVGIGTAAPTAKLDVPSVANPGIKVGNNVTGYLKIGASTWYDDGTYFSLAGGRPFYLRRAEVPVTYIYSPNIYLGDGGSGTNVYFRDANIYGNNFTVYSSGIIQSNSYIQNQGVYYPGRVDVAGMQGSWYLGSHGSYGLYTNTGMYIAGNMWSTGASISGRLTVGEAGGAYTYITLQDDESPNGVKYIHANSNVVGFLSGYGGWLVNWDNAGNMTNAGTINSTGSAITNGYRAGGLYGFCVQGTDVGIGVNGTNDAQQPSLTCNRFGVSAPATCGVVGTGSGYVTTCYCPGGFVKRMLDGNVSIPGVGGGYSYTCVKA